MRLKEFSQILIEKDFKRNQDIRIESHIYTIDTKKWIFTNPFPFGDIKIKPSNLDIKISYFIKDNKPILMYVQTPNLETKGYDVLIFDDTFAFDNEYFCRKEFGHFCFNCIKYIKEESKEKIKKIEDYDQENSDLLWKNMAPTEKIYKKYRSNFYD